MGLFSKKPPPPPPDRDTVMSLLKLGMDETDAADRDIDSREFRAAKDKFETALRAAPKAEADAALDALRRHGY
ncbi:hypothetical protein E1258_31400 [Micromonospora sp. KC207]|uniref:hypothetical protein n=1 Tax=Micromonospora sp. KC207 TaxID=2530377 RepID=UPI00104A5E60|nr:hypothetical protein [Micromonospora sp. KC207]TDC44671.1 hypothetical protein E1258_31400 [Micromonospora sp. KC207]